MSEYRDDVMDANVDELKEHIVGHRIVSAERRERVRISDYNGRVITNTWFEITLDNGKRVTLRDTDDCCAFTSLSGFLLNVENIDHVITSVEADDGFEKWHVYANMLEVLQLDVDWDPSNGYYGYGFSIEIDNQKDNETVVLLTGGEK